jgi:hypothetical protein
VCVCYSLQWPSIEKFTSCSFICARINQNCNEPRFLFSALERPRSRDDFVFSHALEEIWWNKLIKIESWSFLKLMQWSATIVKSILAFNEKVNRLLLQIYEMRKSSSSKQVDLDSIAKLQLLFSFNIKINIKRNKELSHWCINFSFLLLK